VAAAFAPDGFSSRWRTVRGLRLHALEAGPGPGVPVVLLPGLVTASRSMVPLARALAGRGLRAWILDPPGFGYSDTPPRALPIGGQAALAAEWLAALGCRPALVLGNSFGSQVAAALAAGHPGAVSRLVLLSPTVAPPARRRMAWLGAVPVPTGQRRRAPGRRRARLLGRLHRALGDTPPLRLLNVAEYGCAGPLRVAAALRAAVAEPIEQWLPGAAVPALVIRGDEDHLSSPDWAARLATLLPDGRLARLPGLGHDAFYRSPDTVAATAAPFLGAAGPGRAGSPGFAGPGPR
jgi:pimeloyl-ACP methyl ester carboxylesterase